MIEIKPTTTRFAPDIPAKIEPRLLPAANADALYVHVPFCFHKCHYCDFYSITQQSEERMNRFVDLILQESECWTGHTSGPTIRPRTIFFGGGTPSLLPITQMERLIRGLRERFDLSAVDEFTVEVNPATANLEFCRMLRESAVDRLSFGGQSFDRSELKMLERHHDPDDVPRSVEIARRAGFSRINVDLIYAIPGQSLESWSRSLEAVIALATRHISCYALTYEPNTPMAVKKRLGLFKPASDELEIEMMMHTRHRLAETNRFAYEISNYAVTGEECRHNLVYWTGGNYIGLGPSAASHVEGWRWKNRPHLGEWEQSISSDKLPAMDVETLSPERRAGELAMLLLRLARGLNFDDYSNRTGFDARVRYTRQIADCSRAGLIDVDDRGFHLTDAGLSVADAVAAEFLDV